MRKIGDQQRHAIAELIADPLDGPLRLIFDDVMKKGRDDDFVIMDFEVFEQNQRHGAEMLEIPLAGIALHVAERVLGYVIGAPYDLITRIEFGKKFRDSPKETFFILGTGKERHTLRTPARDGIISFIHGTPPMFGH